MQLDPGDVSLTDLAEGTLTGTEWDAWLAVHPDEAAEIAVARRVRLLMAELSAQISPFRQDSKRA